MVRKEGKGRVGKVEWGGKGRGAVCGVRVCVWRREMMEGEGVKGCGRRRGGRGERGREERKRGEGMEGGKRKMVGSL